MDHAWPNPEAPDREAWDAVIVGTGMGGATLGFALASHSAANRASYCAEYSRRRLSPNNNRRYSCNLLNYGWLGLH